VEYWIGTQREEAPLTTPDSATLQRLFHRMQQLQIEIVAMEVSSIALDQYRPWGTQFSVALFTNLTRDHLDYHQQFENYFLAKKRLFTEYSPQCSVINLDDPWGRKLWKEVKKSTRIGFSTKDVKADFFVSNPQLKHEGTHAIVHTPVGKFELATPLIGTHNLYNCLGVIVIAHELGISIESSLGCLGRATAAPGRFERVSGDNIPVPVFVDYAHTEDALYHILTTLKALQPIPGGRLLTVFGCGGDRDRSKRPRMGQVVSTMSDITIVTSDNPRTESPEKIMDEIEAGISRASTSYFREPDRRKAIHLALELATSSDVVLVAGKGHETYQIVGSDRLPFDDRQIVRDYYGNLLR